MAAIAEDVCSDVGLLAPPLPCPGAVPPYCWDMAACRLPRETIPGINGVVVRCVPVTQWWPCTQFGVVWDWPGMAPCIWLVVDALG